MSELIFCLCAWLGVGTPRHERSGLCFPGVFAGPPAPFPESPLPIVNCGRAMDLGERMTICVQCLPRGRCLMAPIVRPGPDPDRDARVARRRASDARRAGQALDALLADRAEGPVILPEAYRIGWADGYAAAQESNSE
jgi:hypothetical protein